MSLHTRPAHDPTSLARVPQNPDKPAHTDSRPRESADSTPPAHQVWYGGACPAALHASATTPSAPAQTAGGASPETAHPTPRPPARFPATGAGTSLLRLSLATEQGRGAPIPAVWRPAPARPSPASGTARWRKTRDASTPTPQRPARAVPFATGAGADSTAPPALSACWRPTPPQRAATSPPTARFRDAPATDKAGAAHRIPRSYARSRALSAPAPQQATTPAATHLERLRTPVRPQPRRAPYTSPIPPAHPTARPRTASHDGHDESLPPSMPALPQTTPERAHRASDSCRAKPQARAIPTPPPSPHTTRPATATPADKRPIPATQQTASAISEATTPDSPQAQSQAPASSSPEGDSWSFQTTSAAPQARKTPHQTDAGGFSTPAPLHAAQLYHQYARAW
ncbi:hypothetical protein HRbin14_02231 [bacterium HR14]|nr:hypothetical protein HRbin14_02231 [bacterium HR14]